MNEIFGHKKTTKEQSREDKHTVEKEQRNLEREIRNLKQQEDKLMVDIKAAARKNDTTTSTILAKQVVQNRAQRERLLKMSGQMNTVKHKTTQMVTNEKMMQAMEKSTSIMGKVNKQMDVQKMNQTMQNYNKETMKMDISDEMLEDMMSGLGDEDEVEVDEAMSQVLDEIGLETGQQLNTIKTGKRDLSQQEEAEADELLKKLGIKN
jgi:charged multivesicular body protein 2B